MTDLALETHGLRRRFGDKLAVADLSLAVRRGEIFGFLGPNGAGKTTSVKMLLGLVKPTAGRGELLGRPLGDRAARGKVGFLPEHFRFHDWLTGRELLQFHGRLLGLGGATLTRRVDELLTRVDLMAAAGRALGTYSKGMLQRAGLAQALLAEPELVFLDEPTSGLDPLGRRLVRDLIGELRARGTAVFLNSHLLGEVEATCDRVVFVKAGRTVHELSLREDERGLPVRIRVGEAGPQLFEALAPVAEGVELAGDIVRMWIADESALPAVAAAVVGSGARLYELTPERKSLEAWFLEVMGADQRPG